jgi:hypothetical protein
MRSAFIDRGKRGFLAPVSRKKTPRRRHKRVTAREPENIARPKSHLFINSSLDDLASRLVPTKA